MADKIRFEIEKKQFIAFVVGVFITIAVLGIFGNFKLPLGNNIQNWPSQTQAEKENNKQLPTCNESESIPEAKKSVVKILGDHISASGFVISKDGFVITNDHVVRGESSFHVVFEDGRSFPATTYNSDLQADIAVVKIVSDQDLTPLIWGISDKLQPGQTVYAIGYPINDVLNGESSITKGVFSAKRTSDNRAIEYIQTDASLNEGNSGGPLLDGCGKVIGINQSTITESTGINFAISQKTASNYVTSLIAGQPRLQGVSAPDNTSELSPVDTVAMFYSLISLRRIEEAFDYLSVAYQQTTDLQDWKTGYQNTLNIYVNDIWEEDSTEPSIYINLTSADLIVNQVKFRNFEGTWHLIKESGMWKLDHGPIREIK